jgi:hypothetical protein
MVVFCILFFHKKIGQTRTAKGQCQGQLKDDTHQKVQKGTMTRPLPTLSTKSPVRRPMLEPQRAQASCLEADGRRALLQKGLARGKSAPGRRDARRCCVLHNCCNCDKVTKQKARQQICNSHIKTQT